jgi:hypothetical protein
MLDPAYNKTYGCDENSTLNGSWGLISCANESDYVDSETYAPLGTQTQDDDTIKSRLRTLAVHSDGVAHQKHASAGNKKGTPRFLGSKRRSLTFLHNMLQRESRSFPHLHNMIQRNEARRRVLGSNSTPSARRRLSKNSDSDMHSGGIVAAKGGAPSEVISEAHLNSAKLQTVKKASVMSVIMSVLGVLNPHENADDASYAVLGKDVQGKSKYGSDMHDDMNALNGADLNAAEKLYDDNGTWDEGNSTWGNGNTTTDEPLTNETDVNATDGAVNETDTNETDTNETGTNETGINETDTNETDINGGEETGEQCISGNTVLRFAPPRAFSVRPKLGPRTGGRVLTVGEPLCMYVYMHGYNW